MPSRNQCDWNKRTRVARINPALRKHLLTLLRSLGCAFPDHHPSFPPLISSRPGAFLLGLGTFFKTRLRPFSFVLRARNTQGASNGKKIEWESYASGMDQR